jgi:hypothetical protein
MESGEPDALTRKGIEIGRGYLASERTQVREAKIIGYNDQKVGARSSNDRWGGGQDDTPCSRYVRRKRWH